MVRAIASVSSSSRPGSGNPLTSPEPVPRLTSPARSAAAASIGRPVRHSSRATPAPTIRELQSAGHAVLAPPNPLRGVAFDAGVVSDVVTAIGGPVVLVGHSYGGAVIGQASAGLDNV